MQASPGLGDEREWAGGPGYHGWRVAQVTMGAPHRRSLLVWEMLADNHSLEVGPYKNPTRAKEARVGHPANVGLFNGVAHQSAVFNPAHGEIVYYAPNQ